MVSCALLVDLIFQKLKKDRPSGQGLVEYALIIVLVAIVIITALTLLGTDLDVTYQNIFESLPK